LAAARISFEQNVICDSSTAAVARFQKQQSINISGGDDATTRQRLGLPEEVPQQGGRN
jgi:hypothetical protein